MCSGFNPLPSQITLYEVGLTVPCLTDWETKKKSYLSGSVTTSSTTVPQVVRTAAKEIRRICWNMSFRKTALIWAADRY